MSLQPVRDGVAALGDNVPYLTEQIVTYLGNKRLLLPRIERAVQKVAHRLGKAKLACLDLFSGTGIVSRLLKHHSSVVYANDSETYAKVLSQCYLANADYAAELDAHGAFEKLKAALADNWVSDGFIAELYAPRNDEDIQPGERAFYTRRNAEMLDTAARLICQFDPKLRPFLLGPLLAEASVHANTAGVFKGFYKDRNGVGKFGGSGADALSRIHGEITLHEPVLSSHNAEAVVFQMDAREALTVLPPVDFAYLDPPYNQHPYGSNYFMLNLLCDYRRPEAVSKVSGIPTQWNRSPYNKKRQAQAELFDVIAAVDAKYLLISYNSEGFIPYDAMVEYLRSLGALAIEAVPYNAYRGSRNLKNRATHVTEHLFLLHKT